MTDSDQLGDNVEPDTATSAAASAKPASVSRRGFLTAGVSAVAGATALAAALSPLRHLDPDDLPTVEEFLQKHYKEMTPEEKQRVLERIRDGGRAAIRREPSADRPAAAGRRRVRLRPEPQPLHRLPQVRPRLRRREQPVAVAARSSTSACWRCTRGASTSRAPNHHYDRPTGPETRTSTTCRSSATSAPSRPASRSARSRRPGRNRTASR